MNTIELSHLHPSIVWQQFSMLSQIPRPSKHEQKLRQHLQQWAEQRGLDSQIDTIGNLIIRKPASVGMEHITGVILQGHLDMVTQANHGIQHDFFHDPIQPVIKDGWLIAENTTLGADNGIGVALALAVLESDQIQHGPIEVLLTIDEEAGMSGARFLEKNILQGKWLFNIDTEEWGELYLGCAGSQDIEVQQQINAIPAPENIAFFDLQVTGLKGGHSGVDIHLGRGNANVILIDFLNRYLTQMHGHLVEFSGGTARNALAREAFATIALPQKYIADFTAQLKQAETIWLKKLDGIDDQLKFNIQENTTNIQKVIQPEQQQAWLNAMANCPYGVNKMSQDLANVVDTSNNIGIVRLNTESTNIVIMVRSLINDEIKSLVDHIQQHFNQYHLPSQLTALVSGWTPNPDSAALKCLQQAYQIAFNLNPELKVIHAGLECGIIAEHYPHLQMVSFGPDIRGAHAPGERVNIASVEKCWQLLVTALTLVK